MIWDWLTKWRYCCLAICISLLLSTGVSRAGDKDAELRQLLDQQSRQIEQQRQQLEELRQRLDAAEARTVGGEPGSLDDNSVKKIVGAYLDEQDKKKKDDDAKAKKEAETEGYRIGTILGITGKFDDNGYPWFSTPNKDFTMHIGSWVQYDNVFWDQSGSLRTAPGTRPGHTLGVASGIATGGIGDLQDGTYFRRIRPFVEGTFWENYEYRLNLALENNQFSTAGLDEFWVAVNKIPVIGTIRVGHVKNAIGFEADMTGSSRTMTFMERSSYSEAIERNENFVTGIWLNNNYEQRATYTFTAFRVDNAQASGAFFGDGQWGAQGRLTWLPIYESDGRDWLHLGISGGWRNGVNNIANSPFRTFQLRARPELRDDDPAGQGGTPAAAVPGGAQTIPNANSNRMVDTGAIAAHDQYLLGLEGCWVRGPFSVQGEYGWTWVDRAFGIAPTGRTLNPAIVPESDYTFNGGYVQLAYTLTGENRAYDRARGTLARPYFNRGPYTPAWLVRDENGDLNWGWGAWELAGRFSYIDLNDGSGLNRIQGGIMEGFTVALNWYLNTNLTCMFDWVYDHRDDVPSAVGRIPGTIPGWTSGFGMRVQLSF
jgi:phosphate-selective porin OprO/OprP